MVAILAFPDSSDGAEKIYPWDPEQMAGSHINHQRFCGEWLRDARSNILHPEKSKKIVQNMFLEHFSLFSKQSINSQIVTLI